VRSGIRQNSEHKAMTGMHTESSAALRRVVHTLKLMIEKLLFAPRPGAAHFGPQRQRTFRPLGTDFQFRRPC
jgi:hypothetical protein